MCSIEADLSSEMGLHLGIFVVFCQQVVTRGVLRFSPAAGNFACSKKFILSQITVSFVSIAGILFEFS